MRLSPVALYAPWPEGSRRTWGQVSPFVALISYVLSIIPAAFVSGATGAVIALGAGEATGGTMAAARHPAVILSFIAVQFPVWAWLVFIWGRRFERRDGASMGLGGPDRIARYARGVAVGAGCAALLIICAGAVASVFPPEGIEQEIAAGGENFDAARLFAPAAIALFAVIAVIFLVQGAMEEVVFRGWLMSALAARWGAAVAVALSTVSFTVLHAQVFVSGAAYGAVALAGLGATGLFFALYALWERSVWGVLAAHGAFNIIVLTLPLAAGIATREDGDAGAAFAEALSRVTGQAGPDAVTLGPQNWVQMTVFMILSAGMLVLLRRTRSNPVDGEATGG